MKKNSYYLLSFLLCLSSVIPLIHGACETRQITQYLASYGYIRWILQTACYNITSDNIHQELASIDDSDEYFFYNSSITSLPMGVFISNRVSKLYINNSQIETVQTRAFSGLVQLEEIYLQFNFLQVVSRGSFNSLTTLKILDLSNNRIDLIEDDAFNGNNKMKTILLNNNNIKVVPHHLFHSLAQLEKIYLQFNLLQVVSEGSFNSTTLNILDLSNNQIDLFEDGAFNDNNKLQMILLNNNNIKVVPHYLFYSFKNIRTVNLSHNFIQTFNFSFNLSKPLWRLDLNSNNITNIDCSFLKSSSFTGLKMADNFLTDFDGYCFPKYLRNIILKNNSLNRFSNMSLLPSLQTCDFSNNNLSILKHGDFQNLKRLEYLHLQGNSIKDLLWGIFKDLSSLKTLNVSWNSIENLDYGVFKGLDQLDTLDLSHNSIRFLEEDVFSNLRQLTVLNVSYNNLAYLNLVKLTSYSKHTIKIDLIGNNLTCQRLSAMVSYELPIIIVNGTFHNVSNVNGIPCTNFNALTVTPSVKTNNPLKDIRSFFETDFQNTSFFKFFSDKKFTVNNYYNSKFDHSDDDLVQLTSEVKTSNVVLIIFVFINFIVTFGILAIIILILKKLVRQHVPLEQPELHLL